MLEFNYVKYNIILVLIIYVKQNSAAWLVDSTDPWGRDVMDDTLLNKSFFFDWGKKRINLTKYLIEHNKNNSHWSNVISIDEPEDKAVFERYHEKQGDVFLDEMIKEIDEMVKTEFPKRMKVIYSLFNSTDKLTDSFEKMMRVRRMIADVFEEFAERRILKLPIMQKRYFRSLFFYNANLENIMELRSYIRSYFKMEDDIDEDMKIQARNVRKITQTILDSLHNQFYLDFQKELEIRYLKNNNTHKYTRPIIHNYKTVYYTKSPPEFMG